MTSGFAKMNYQQNEDKLMTDIKCVDCGKCHLGECQIGDWIEHRKKLCEGNEMQITPMLTLKRKRGRPSKASKLCEKLLQNYMQIHKKTMDSKFEELITCGQCRISEEDFSKI